MDIMHDRAGYYLCWGCLCWVPVRAVCAGACWDRALHVIGGAVLSSSRYYDGDTLSV